MSGSGTSSRSRRPPLDPNVISHQLRSTSVGSEALVVSEVDAVSALRFLLENPSGSRWAAMSSLAGVADAWLDRDAAGVARKSGVVAEQSSDVRPLGAEQ